MDTYAQQLCARCGSKKRISRKWTEMQKTFAGETKVEFTQIVCTNAVCQAAFEKNLAKETREREIIVQKREEDKLQRKNDALLQASKTRKNKLKI